MGRLLPQKISAYSAYLIAAMLLSLSMPDDLCQASEFYGYTRDLARDTRENSVPNGGIARYVDPKIGRNSGGGSRQQPWQDLNYALRNCTPGDTIFLRGGQHNYSLSINNQVAASKLNPVEIRSFPGEWAIFDGSASTNDQALFMLSNESWLIFRDFEVRHSKGRALVTSGIYLYKVENCIFQNVYSHHHNGSGFKLHSSDRNTFINCTSSDNFDTASGGKNADGFAVNSGNGNSFIKCVASLNSDDGFDFWMSSGNTCDNCIADHNGVSAGDGAGFKLGGGQAQGGGHHILYSIAANNKKRGFTENSARNGSSFVHCVAFDSGWANWRLARARARHKVINSISFGNGSRGDELSAAEYSACLGGGFGGQVTSDDFESTDIRTINNNKPGERFLFPLPASKQLIDRGIDVGQPFQNRAPDIGAREFRKPL